ncbi:MAG: hypothetical protein WCW14_04770 [Candidatus Paceibacterota bacterium]|jgi:hypothetical protein
MWFGLNIYFDSDMSKLSVVMSNRKNVLLLGASGAMSAAFLHHLRSVRDTFGDLVLLDKRILPKDPFIIRSHYSDFIQMNVTRRTIGKFVEVINSKKIDVVIDLSNADTDLVSEAIFGLENVSYIGSSFSNREPLGRVMPPWMTKIRKMTHKVPHILNTGMNSGVVNIWAAYGIRKYGRPKGIVEFEYDSTNFREKIRSDIVTWNIEDFLEGLIADPAALAVGRNIFVEKKHKAMSKTYPLRTYLQHFVKLDRYPRGAMVAHEECITLAGKYDVPVRYLYALHPAVMRYLKGLLKKRSVCISALELVRNSENNLTGADSIGMQLEYEDKYVYYFNSVKNESMQCCTATAYQVIVGIYAAFFSILDSKIKAGVYLPEDLLDTIYSRFVFHNLPTIEKVILKSGKVEKRKRVQPTHAVEDVFDLGTRVSSGMHS